MNLKNLFNKNYLIQNLKKSTGVLAFSLALIPIFNFLMYLMYIIDASSGVTLFSLERLSYINAIGHYILPVVISMCLFGWVFKKTSTDFINSMPISRSAMFVTNTIAGIFIFIAMLIINILILLIVNMFASKIIVPPIVFLEYVVYWFISFMFIFTIANLAMSISGNKITQIVLTLLLTFLMPLLIDYTFYSVENNYINTNITCKSDACKPIEYYCYGDTDCEYKKINGVYNIYLKESNTTTHTIPYQMIRNVLTGDTPFIRIEIKALVITSILSILYFGLGLYTFNKRKMEVNETTFKSKNVHNIVKCMTLIPAYLIIYEIISQTSVELITILTIIVLLLTYYFVYDLITRKKIFDIRRGLITLSISLVIVLGYAFLIDTIKDTSTADLNISDIKSVSVVPNEVYRRYDDTTKFKNIFIDDKKLINLIMRHAITNTDYNENPTEYVYTTIKFNNNKKYSLDFYMNIDEYLVLLEYLDSIEEYRRQLESITETKVYSVSFNDFSKRASSSGRMISLVKSSLKETSLLEFYKASVDKGDLYLYYYDKNNVNSFRFPISLNDELESSIIKSYNDKVRNSIRTIMPSHIYHIWTNRFYDNADSYVIDYSISEILNFIKDDVQNDIDISKDYFKISFYTYEGEYTYYTNNIEGFRNLLDAQIELIKDTEEFKYYLENNHDKMVDEVEYYD